VVLQRNVFSILDGSARGPHGDDPAMGFEGDVVSFRELRDRALRLAAGLAAHGVRRGDRVAVMVGNRMEWPEVFFGLAALGAVCVPVNVLLTAPEVAHVCTDSGADLLVMDEVATASVRELSQEFRLVVCVGEATYPHASPVVRYRAVVAAAADGVVGDGPDLDDTFILYYSSGTTGLPKAAEHTHNGILWNSFAQIGGLGLSRHVRYAVIPSLSWAAGFHDLMLALVWAGGYSEIRRTGGASAEQIVDLVVRERITHTFLVPSLLRELPARPDLCERLRASELVWVLTGSEPVPRRVIEECAEQMPGIAVCQGYGLSEFPTIATVLAPEETAAHEGSAGRALPTTDLAVKDSEGAVLSSVRGELLIRSPATMRGYYGRPEATDAAFEGGWLHTGDLVDLDEEGFVTIVGRTKDMIISGGLNVYPKEIEDVIHRLVGVLEVAVVGVPHERFGETAVAVVVTDNADFVVDVVHEVCVRELASYKRPRHVLVRRDPLPRSANAKILKRNLRPWVLAELGWDGS
jgi:fatty-acyl-CoA synthase